jgi:hypothetical protein
MISECGQDTSSTGSEQDRIRFKGRQTLSHGMELVKFVERRDELEAFT